MDTNLGKILKDRYEIKSKISSGGTSQIYLAQDLKLKRLVVIKIFFQKIFSSTKNKDLFLNEIQITSKLKHKNIVKLLDFFNFDDLLCLILEYAQGPTLRDLIDQQKNWTTKEISIIFDQILEVLQFAQNKKIIHRDLKPENIIILKDNKIKILDFGISIDRNYLIHQIKLPLVGSVKYMAPELIANQTATFQSDIYSVGILLYEVLIGQPPFISENVLLLMKKHLYEKVIRVRHYDQNISQQMENIVVLATAKNPEERYLNASQMLKDWRAMNNLKVQPSAIFLKQEIYSGSISNEALSQVDKNFVQSFWLERKFFFVFLIIFVMAFLVFLIVISWKILEDSV